MPDFTLKDNFPIAAVIQAAQQNAQRQMQAREAGNESLVKGLQSIGQVGQSLFEQRKKTAQALALGQQFDINPEVAKMMDTDQILKVAAIKKGSVDMNMLMNLLHPGAFPPAGTSSPSKIGSPSATPASVPANPTANPSNGAMLTSNVTTTPINDQPLTPSPTGQIPVPIQAPPVKPPTVNKATSDAAIKLFGMTKPEPVISQADALAAGSVPKGTHIISPHSQLDVGLKEDQFYQREWDKLLKESDPLNASSRTPLGLASRATFQANRALKTLSNPVVTNQEAGNAMADIAAIYQNGSPTQFGMSHQQYETLYAKIQGILQNMSGKPQDALPDAIKSRLVGVLNDMKITNSALLKQRLDMTEKSKKAVIARFPDEWKEYRQILEGDQGQYNGLPPPTTAPPQSGGWTNENEQRLQMLLEKQKNGSLRS